MLKLTVKVVGKDIVSDKGNFTAYSVLTSQGNWYKVAKAKPEDLKKVNGEVVTLTVSRKFDKKVVVDFEERLFPTLVIEEISTPTAKELETFNKELQAMNDKTLEGIR